VVEDFQYVDEALCGFPVTFVDSGTFKLTTFHDAAGNPTKAVARTTRSDTQSARQPTTRRSPRTPRRLSLSRSSRAPNSCSAFTTPTTFPAKGSSS
jgi:hypothetical protein